MRAIAFFALTLLACAGSAFATDPPLAFTVLSDATAFKAGSIAEITVRIRNTGSQPFTFFSGDLSAELCYRQASARSGFGCGGTVGRCVTGSGFDSEGKLICSGMHCEGEKVTLGPGASQQVRLPVPVPKELAGTGHIGRLQFALQARPGVSSDGRNGWRGRFEFKEQPIVIRSRDSI